MASYKFFGTMWDDLKWYEKCLAITVAICSILIFFSTKVGKFINTYPNNLCFDFVFVAVYCAISPMPHQKVINAAVSKAARVQEWLRSGSSPRPRHTSHADVAQTNGQDLTQKFGGEGGGGGGRSRGRTRASPARKRK